MAEVKPTKIEKIKADQKAWKAGVAALARRKFITKEEKAAMIAEYDGKFKELIKIEKEKEKAKRKKAK